MLFCPITRAIRSYRFPYRVGWFGALGVLALSAVAASPAMAARSILSEEIVVTASRTGKPLGTIPNTVTLIGFDELSEQISINNDISTVLGNLIPSFSPSRQKLTSSGETLRGRSPLYMIDGVPQSNPLRDGGRAGHTIDPAMLERVEVIHGANAVHGLGAAGGIINLITKRPTGELVQSLRVSIDAQQEDFGESLGYGANYSLSGSADQFDMVASIGYQSSGVSYDANGDVIGFDTTQGDTMDARSIDTFLKLGYNLDQQRIELSYNHYHIEGRNDWGSIPGDVKAGIPTVGVRMPVEGDAPANEVTTISLSYSHQSLFGHALKAQLFSQEFAGTYGGNRFDTFQDPALGSNIFDQSENQSDKYGLKLTLSKDGVAGLPVNLIYGIDLFQDTTTQELIQTGRAWVPETEYRNYAPFLQGEYAGIENLVISAGVRQEESTLEVEPFVTLASYGSQYVEGGDPSFSETLGNVGATWQLTDVVRIYGNYSESFSMPDVGRVLRGINQPGLSVESFLDLKPITTDNAEVGIELSFEQLRGQLTYYTSESDFGQRLERGPDGIYSVNREKTEIDGVEFRVDWLASDRDVFGLRYAHTEGEYDSDGDGSVDSDLAGVNIAPDRVNLSWNRDWTDGISTRLQINHLIDRDFDNAAGERYEAFDGYTTTDFHSSWKTEVGQFSFSIQNLGDTDYFTYYSQAGGGNADRNFKGIGRSFRLAYDIQF